MYLCLPTSIVSIGTIKIWNSCLTVLFSHDAKTTDFDGTFTVCKVVVQLSNDDSFYHARIKGVSNNSSWFQLETLQNYNTEIN